MIMIYRMQKKINATHFKSSLFINQNNETYNISSLPNTSQLAPTNSFINYDVDANGSEELISVGNHYSVEVETGRSDAHIGNVISIENTSLTISNLSYMKTGFYNQKDARCIKKIKINNKNYLIVANNRDKINFFKLTN